MIPKFRAWDKRWKEWLTDCYVGQDGRVYRFSKETSYGNAVRLETRDDIILMQSTGLFDKNGKEIFEGDRVAWTSLSGRKVGKGVIKHGGNVFLISGDGKVIHMKGSYRYEIQGNIHQHPDLLEAPDGH